ncbi:jhy protein homolog [Salvelinus sp. IW2-2015]|uniref:jhy protein homolog n=1 Tax=Salvelinus sp. IW2-2015 TaxID=2691554 RepID=UPI000CDFE8B3|nr:jhy protein homolog [Salvelinus alpinus]
MEGKKGPEHGKTYVRLKDEHRKPCPLKPEVGLSLWDAAESDTESLVQERDYQLELQRRIGVEFGDQNMTQPQEEDTDGSCLDEGELHIYDSLEVSALRQNKKNVQQQSRDKEVSRQIHYDDTYAELRYDPNWRTNLEGARQFDKMTPPLPLEEESYNSDEQSEESHSERGQELSGSGGYRYIFSCSPALAESMTPEITSNELQSKHHLTSYHLPPLQNQVTREVSPAFSYHLPQNQVIGDSLPESTHPSPGVPSEKAMERNPHQRVKANRGVRNPTNATGGEIQASSADLEDRYRETHDRYDRAFQIYYNQEQYGQTSGTVAEKQLQNSMSSKSNGSRHLSSRKPDIPRENIIERNRVTLGINAAKQGSYLRAHAQQKEVKSDSPNQVCNTTDEITIGGNQEEESQGDNSDPELRWLQKTQQLKVTQISKEKQAQQRVNPKPPSEKRLLAQGVKARPRDCYLSPPTDTTRPAARTQAHSHPHHQPQHSPHLQALSDTDSQSSILDTQPHQPQCIPLTQSPTVHLNINTSSKLLAFMHCNHQDAVLTIPKPFSGPSPQRKPQSIDGYSPNANVPLRNTIPVNPYSHPGPHPCPQDHGSLQLALIPQADVSPLSPGRGSRSSQGFPGMPPLCQGSREPPHLWHQENAPLQRENHIVLQYDEDSHRSTYTAETKYSSSSYTVLPPIGKRTTGDPELGRDRAAQIFTSMQRSSSEAYLAQMRREKQLKERVIYKAYTLKDYKQLKQDVYLGGLGPDYTTTEITAEKMRRQKLYSNVIREQNKKISRIPFLPAARNAVGSNNKDNMVPRRKALEYARSILRPKVVPQAQQPKTREPERAQAALRGNTRLREGLDLSQLATVEALRKRHEQEKQTVARFNVVHAI